MSIQFAVISLWAEDVPAAAHFYRDVIGLRMLPHHAGRAHFDLDGVYLVILQGKPYPAQDPVPARFPQVAFRVEDLDEAVARLQQYGINLPWGIESDAASRWAMFFDPGGNLIELAQFGNPRKLE